jgi:hypothetical protein
MSLNDFINCECDQNNVLLHFTQYSPGPPFCTHLPPTVFYFKLINTILHALCYHLISKTPRFNELDKSTTTCSHGTLPQLMFNSLKIIPSILMLSYMLSYTLECPLTIGISVPCFLFCPLLSNMRHSSRV